MPLINLKTDLKSLKFGVGTASDRPGGGFSNQPYIIKDIPSDSSDPSNVFNTGGTDSLLRGGLMAPIKAVNDVSRLTQMFFDTRSPNGLLFTAKQNLLSRTSVKTEASIGPGTAGGTVNQGVYLPTSTIAQAGVGFLGAHGNLLGLNPLSPGGNNPSLSDQISNAGLVKYESVITDQGDDFEEKNRLVSLFNAIETNTTPFPINGTTLNANAGTSIMQYSGGPGSILGIGKTNIPFSSERTMGNLGRSESEITPPTPLEPNGFIKTHTIQHSRPSGYKVGYTDAKAIDQRINRGNPGKRNDNVSYTIGNNEALDKINTSDITKGSPTPTDLDVRNDLVKFSIGILNNDGNGNSRYMHFRSFIDSFDDSYSADWGETQYVGRGDKFYNYKGFNRQINMGWTTYAQSKQELIPMYKKLNFLASSLAPDYSSGGFMRGNLARLTVGGYLYNQLGIIKSITYTIPQESTWEIGIDDNGDFDPTVKELAHMIKVTGFTFIPIEDQLPQLESKFIALSNGSTDLY